jgi:hypothetical protein
LGHPRCAKPTKKNNIHIHMRQISECVNCHKCFACWTQELNKNKWQHQSLQPQLARQKKPPLHAACPLAISTSSSPAKNNHKRHVIKKPETSPR